MNSFRRLFWGLLLAILVSIESAAGKIAIVAHRGGAADAPENTIAAFASAQAYADYQEFDVWPTADGHLIVMHDLSVDRTTNGTGQVIAMTLAQIKSLDAGAKYDFRFAGEKVPTAAEALDFIQKNSAPFMEAKGGTVAQYVDLLTRHPLRPEAVVIGFNYAFVVNLKKALPGIRVGLLGQAPLTESLLSQAVADGVSHFCWPSSYIDAAMLTSVHAHGGLVFAWTVNDVAEMKRMAALGVDGIITDRVSEFSKLPELVDNAASAEIKQHSSLELALGQVGALSTGIIGRFGENVVWRRSGDGEVVGRGSTLLLQYSNHNVLGSYVAQWDTNTGRTERAFTVAHSQSVTRLANLSARVSLEPSYDGIIGFVLDGLDARLLLRAVGPSLSRFNVPNPVLKPQLLLYDFNGLVEAVIAPWSSDSDLASEFKLRGAFPLDANGEDVATIRTLSPGPYTARIPFSGAASEVGLIEVYHDMASSSRLRNVAIRGASRPTSPLTAGFVVQGAGSNLILIRGLGPALKSFGVPGVLSDPVLQLFRSSDSTLIAANDDGYLSGARHLDRIAAQVGAFPIGPGAKDAAILVSLPAGDYTAVLSGAGRSPAGVGLIEVYSLD